MHRCEFSTVTNLGTCGTHFVDIGLPDLYQKLRNIDNITPAPGLWWGETAVVKNDKTMSMRGVRAFEQDKFPSWKLGETKAAYIGLAQGEQGRSDSLTVSRSELIFMKLFESELIENPISFTKVVDDWLKSDANNA